MSLEYWGILRELEREYVCSGFGLAGYNTLAGDTPAPPNCPHVTLQHLFLFFGVLPLPSGNLAWALEGVPAGPGP